MTTSHRTRIAALCLVVAFVLQPVRHAQAQADADAFAAVAANYAIYPDITYFTAGGVDLKLDVYRPGGDGVRPTLVYYHGGGWTSGSKESSMMNFLPYLQQGWAVVNVEYRLARQALAPAAVEDSRCALRWVYRNARQYGFDLDAIVLSGSSAGGHLALITGMAPDSAGFDLACPGNRSRVWTSGENNTEALRVAAIVNWYGITDVADMIGFQSGPSGPFTDAWLGNNPNRQELARQVSPLSHVRPGLPPVMTIHGDADPVVPYSNARRLQQALNEAGVPNELITVAGGGHGGFSGAVMVDNFRQIRRFLESHGIGP